MVFDGESQEYECVIDDIAKDKAELSVLRLRSGLMVSIVEPSVVRAGKALSIKLDLTLACALPKKVKMDYIIEKTVELGVDRIIPIKTERTIVEYSPEKAKEKLKRWQAIAIEASKQCGRIKLPEIKPVSGFDKIVSQVKNYELAVIPHLGPGNKSLKEIFCDSRPSSLIIFIGPEGDFSGREIKLAKENGCIGVSLGDLVLKVDTAAISVIAFSRLFTSYYEDI